MIIAWARIVALEIQIKCANWDLQKLVTDGMLEENKRRVEERHWVPNISNWWEKDTVDNKGSGQFNKWQEKVRWGKKEKKKS